MTKARTRQMEDDTNPRKEKIIPAPYQYAELRLLQSGQSSITSSPSTLYSGDPHLTENDFTGSQWHGIPATYRSKAGTSGKRILAKAESAVV